LPEFQNKGIGTTVLQHLIKQSAALKTPISLEVQKVNTLTKKFYEKNGFEAVEVTEKDFIMKFYSGVILPTRR